VHPIRRQAAAKPESTAVTRQQISKYDKIVQKGSAAAVIGR
jgi:hypothetical protein